MDLWVDGVAASKLPGKADLVGIHVCDGDVAKRPVIDEVDAAPIGELRDGKLGSRTRICSTFSDRAKRSLAPARKASRSGLLRLRARLPLGRVQPAALERLGGQHQHRYPGHAHERLGEEEAVVGIAADERTVPVVRKDDRDARDDEACGRGSRLPEAQRRPDQRREDEVCEVRLPGEHEGADGEEDGSEGSRFAARGRAPRRKASGSRRPSWRERQAGRRRCRRATTCATRSRSPRTRRRRRSAGWSRRSWR